MFWAGYFLLSLVYSVNCGTVFKTILKPGSGECNEFRSYINWKSTKSRKTPNVNASQSRLKWILRLSRIKFGINCTTFKSHLHFGMIGVWLNTLCSRDRMEIQRTYQVFLHAVLNV